MISTHLNDGTILMLIKPTERGICAAVGAIPEVRFLRFTQVKNITIGIHKFRAK
jgi:hypothetical protein